MWQSTGQYIYSKLGWAPTDTWEAELGKKAPLGGKGGVREGEVEVWHAVVMDFPANVASKWGLTVTRSQGALQGAA